LFLSLAAEEGLMNLKGLRMAGGFLASLYNAMPNAGVTALITFMQHFADMHWHHV
jgi:phosphoserine aminotransferase